VKNARDVLALSVGNVKRPVTIAKKYFALTVSQISAKIVAYQCANRVERNTIVYYRRLMSDAIRKFFGDDGWNTSYIS